MHKSWDLVKRVDVAPLVGAWIEIAKGMCALSMGAQSHPSWGAWIEITCMKYCRNILPVAPLVGAWIEIIWGAPKKEKPNRSHPSWVRGLKLLKLQI